jgi:hypothetical protein
LDQLHVANPAVSRFGAAEARCIMAAGIIGKQAEKIGDGW